MLLNNIEPDVKTKCIEEKVSQQIITRRKSSTELFWPRWSGWGMMSGWGMKGGSQNEKWEIT